jgi:hypothetical protein
MRALDGKGSRVLAWAAAVIAGAAATGCVSEATYQDALREAQSARIEAAQREQQSRFQQAQLAWLAEQIEKRSGAGADARATAELARAARDLSGWVQACKGSPEPNGSGGDGASGTAAPRPGGGAVERHRPLDKGDPWGMPRQALAPPGAARRKDALAAKPLDDDDPWAARRPALDGDDPWLR